MPIACTQSQNVRQNIIIVNISCEYPMFPHLFQLGQNILGTIFPHACIHLCTTNKQYLTRPVLLHDNIWFPLTTLCSKHAYSNTHADTPLNICKT